MCFYFYDSFEMKKVDRIKETDLLSDILKETKASLNPLKNEIEWNVPSYKELWEKAKKLENRYEIAFWKRDSSKSPRPFVFASDNSISVRREGGGVYELYPSEKKLVVYSDNPFDKWIKSSLSDEDYNVIEKNRRSYICGREESWGSRKRKLENF